MSKYTGYDEKSKERTMRYQKKHRESLTLNLPIGTKAKWRERAEKAGFDSVTSYLSYLSDRDNASRACRP